jgi:hypothetical protein
MISSIKNENLIITEHSYKLLSDLHIEEVEVLYKKVSDIKDLIGDLSSELEEFDIAVLKDLNVCVGLDELGSYLGEYLNDRENYEQHFDEESDEDDSNDEYNSVGELKSEL